MHLVSETNWGVVDKLYEHLQMKYQKAHRLNQVNQMERSLNSDKQASFCVAKSLKDRLNLLDSQIILLKLMCPNLDNFSEVYRLGHKVSFGAFSTVYDAAVRWQPPAKPINYLANEEPSGSGLTHRQFPRRVVKLVQVSQNVHDRNPLYFLFSEIKILNTLYRRFNHIQEEPTTQDSPMSFRSQTKRKTTHKNFAAQKNKIQISNNVLDDSKPQDFDILNPIFQMTSPKSRNQTANQVIKNIRSQDLKRTKSAKYAHHPLLPMLSYGFSSNQGCYYGVFPKYSYLKERCKSISLESNEQFSITNRFKIDNKQDTSVYYNLFRIIYKLIKDLKFLHGQEITHFDLKADNIMYYQTQGPFLGDEGTKQNIPFNSECSMTLNAEKENNVDGPEWKAQENAHSIRGKWPIVIDYGESLMGSENTRLRGTEYMRSPELLVASFQNFGDKSSSSFHARSISIQQKKLSTNDIWALGCLVYELLTGEVLFYSQNWIEFFSHVTNNQKPILKPANVDKIQKNPYILKLLLFLLVRDEEKRPDILKVEIFFDSLLMAYDHQFFEKMKSQFRDQNTKIEFENQVIWISELESFEKSNITFSLKNIRKFLEIFFNRQLDRNTNLEIDFGFDSDSEYEYEFEKENYGYTGSNFNAFFDSTISQIKLFSELHSNKFEVSILNFGTFLNSLLFLTFEPIYTESRMWICLTKYLKENSFSKHDQFFVVLGLQIIFLLKRSLSDQKIMKEIPEIPEFQYIPPANKLEIFQLIKIYKTILTFCQSQRTKKIECQCKKTEFIFCVQNDAKLSFDCCCRLTDSKPSAKLDCKKAQINAEHELNPITKYFWEDCTRRPRQMKKHPECLYNDCEKLSRRKGQNYVKWTRFIVPNGYNFENPIHPSKRSKNDGLVEELVRKIFIEYENIRNLDVKWVGQGPVREIKCFECGELLAMVDRTTRTLLTYLADQEDSL